MLRLKTLAIVIAMVGVGCTATSTPTPPTSTQVPTQIPAPTPIAIYVTPAPTPVASVGELPGASEPPATTTPSIAPPTEPATTPFATAAVAQDQPVLRTWRGLHGGGVNTLQVITPVTNTGTTWIELLAPTSVRIYDSSGGITATGLFGYSVGPRFLRPGETGYTVAETFGGGDSSSNYASAQMDVSFQHAVPHEPLTVDNVRVQTAVPPSPAFEPYFGRGVTVTGEVLNTGMDRIESADVVAVFLDSSGSPLGYNEGLAENIEPGATGAFEARTGFADIRLSEISQTLVFASDFGAAGIN